jgi:hypothetical protein
VNDVLPQVLWTKYFLEAQGYDAIDAVIYQDNQSAILLEKNGRASSSKRTRHLNIRYFFIYDRIESKEVRVEYCGTDDMIADFFSKPLQGSLFKKFRDFIMNITPSTTSTNADPSPRCDEDHRSVLEPEKQDDGWTVYTKKQKQKWSRELNGPVIKMRTVNNQGGSSSTMTQDNTTMTSGENASKQNKQNIAEGSL